MPRPLNELQRQRGARELTPSASSEEWEESDEDEEEEDDEEESSSGDDSASSEGENGVVGNQGPPGGGQVQGGTLNPGAQVDAPAPGGAQDPAAAANQAVLAELARLRKQVKKQELKIQKMQGTKAGKRKMKKKLTKTLKSVLRANQVTAEDFFGARTELIEDPNAQLNYLLATDKSSRRIFTCNEAMAVRTALQTYLQILFAPHLTSDDHRRFLDFADPDRSNPEMDSSLSDVHPALRLRLHVLKHVPSYLEAGRNTFRMIAAKRPPQRGHSGEFMWLAEMAALYMVVREYANGVTLKAWLEIAHRSAEELHAVNPSYVGETRHRSMVSMEASVIALERNLNIDPTAGEGLSTKKETPVTQPSPGLQETMTEIGRFTARSPASVISVASRPPTAIAQARAAAPRSTAASQGGRTTVTANPGAPRGSKGTHPPDRGQNSSNGVLGMTGRYYVANRCYRCLGRGHRAATCKGSDDWHEMKKQGGQDLDLLVQLANGDILCP